MCVCDRETQIYTRQRERKREREREWPLKRPPPPQRLVGDQRDYSFPKETSSTFQFSREKGKEKSQKIHQFQISFIGLLHHRLFFFVSFFFSFFLCFTVYPFPIPQTVVFAGRNKVNSFNFFTTRFLICPKFYSISSLPIFSFVLNFTSFCLSEAICNNIFFGFWLIWESFFIEFGELNL